jgi:hypothetical protein
MIRQLKAMSLYELAALRDRVDAALRSKMSDAGKRSAPKGKKKPPASLAAAAKTPKRRGRAVSR